MPLTPRPHAPPMRARAAVRSVMQAAARRGAALLAAMEASGHHALGMALRGRHTEVDGEQYCVEQVWDIQPLPGKVNIRRWFRDKVGLHAAGTISYNLTRAILIPGGTRFTDAVASHHLTVYAMANNKNVEVNLRMIPTRKSPAENKTSASIGAEAFHAIRAMLEKLAFPKGVRVELVVQEPATKPTAPATPR